MTRPTGPTSPRAMHAALEEAFDSGDVDAYTNVYSDDALLVVPPDGRVLRGRAEIKADAVDVFARNPHMTITVDTELETEGLALTQTHWHLRLDVDNGGRAEMTGRAAVVSRRRDDGTWEIVVDNPMA